MKRYFISTVPAGSTAFHCGSAWHAMALPGASGLHDGGHIIVMMDGEFDPDPTWTELPHLLEAVPANFNGINTTAGAFVAAAGSVVPASIAGVVHTDTMFQVAKKLAAINSHFCP